MSSITRRATQSDEKALQLMWKTVFGDSDEAIDLFFETYFDPNMTVVADSESGPAAAGYILPVGQLLFGEQSLPYANLPCAMIYSVATLPASRGLGHGTAVVNDLIQLGFAEGYKAVVLCPATDSLFEYYSSRTRLRDWFYVCEGRYDPSHASDSPAIELTAISPEKYHSLRNNLLGGIPHIECDLRALSYQKLLCGQYGGGLFRAGSPRGEACLAAEKQADGSLWIKELLLSNVSEADAMAAVAASFPDSDIYFRSPSSISGSSYQTRRFGMLALPDDFDHIDIEKIPLLKDKPYYGLAFD